MSDIPASPPPGSLSPRNIDTVLFRVVAELGQPGLPVGAHFAWWPQGEVFGHVSGLGLGLVKNSQILEWETAGKIVRVAR